MSIEEIKNQINMYEEEIINLEIEFSKKQILAKKEIDEKYRSIFELTLAKFKNRMQNVNKINFNEKKHRFENIRKEIRILLKKLKLLEANKFADKWKKWSNL